MNKNILNKIYNIYSKNVWKDKIKKVCDEYMKRIQSNSYMLIYDKLGRCKKCKNYLCGVLLCHIKKTFIYNVHLCNKCSTDTDTIIKIPNNY